MEQQKNAFLLKISVILMLVLLMGAAFFFCCHLPFFAIAPSFEILSGSTQDGANFLEKRETEKLYSKLSPIERKFVSGYENCNDSWIKELYDAEPENVLYTSLYAVKLLSSYDPEWKPDPAKIRPVLEQWKKIDPDNGMPYFLGAYMELSTGYKEERIEKENQPTEFKYIITDKAAVERGVKEYRTGLTKKYAKAYALERQRERLRLVDPPKTPFGVMKRIEISAGTLLPHLSMERLIALYLGDYARKLHAAGNVKEAEELTASGKTYLLLRLKEQETFFISVMVHIAINSIWLETAKDIKNPKLEKVYTPIKEYYNQWKKAPDLTGDITKRHGGILSAMLLPCLKKEIDPELLKPERMVNYLLMDQFQLLLLYFYIALIITVFTGIGLIGLCFKKFPDWQNLPQKSWFRIFLSGLGIPLLLYLIYIHVDFCSGRNMNPVWSPLRTAVPYFYLLFIVPLIFFIAALVELKWKLKKTFFPILWNLIALMIVFLFLTTGILTTVYRLEINHYLKKDQLWDIQDGFTTVEVSLSRDFQEEMNKVLQKK